MEVANNYRLKDNKMIKKKKPHQPQRYENKSQMVIRITVQVLNYVISKNPNSNLSEAKTKGIHNRSPLTGECVWSFWPLDIWSFSSVWGILIPWDLEEVGSASVTEAGMVHTTFQLPLYPGSGKPSGIPPQSLNWAWGWSRRATLWDVAVVNLGSQACNYRGASGHDRWPVLVGVVAEARFHLLWQNVPPSSRFCVRTGAVHLFIQ